MHKCWFLRGGSAGTFSLFPNSIHSCAAVKLGSEETKEKSIRVSVWPLIFSLLPSFFSPHLHHPIFLSLSPSCFLRWSMVANPSSRPPLARSGHPISHGFTLLLPPQLPALEKVTQQPTRPLHSSSPPASHQSWNTLSILSPFLPPRSLSAVKCLSRIPFCALLHRLHRCSLFSSKRTRNTYLLAEDHIMILPPTSICDLHFVWIIRRALFSIIFCHI